MILHGLKLVFRNPSRAWLMARMAAWIVVLSALANALSLPRALRIVSTDVRRKGKVEVDPVQLSTAIDALLGADFLVFKPSCWKRATVLHRYFALAGVATTIRFGVTREPKSELKGHAWLELDGQPILESSPPNYKITYTFPSKHDVDVHLAIMTE